MIGLKFIASFTSPIELDIIHEIEVALEDMDVERPPAADIKIASNWL